MPGGLDPNDPSGEQLFFGDLAAISLAWGLPMLFQSRLRPDQSVAVWLAAAVSTLAVIQMAGLYRSWVCSEFSRQAARIIAATAVGGFVLAASGWLAGSRLGRTRRTRRRGSGRRRRIDDRAALAL